MADETPIVVEDATVDSKGFVADEEINPTCSQETKKELEFSKDEETLIIRMYNLVGERWPLIAGRIPGRSAEEIEKFWNSRQPTTEQEPQNSSPVAESLPNNED